jgi:hypothetical protein
MVNPENTVTTLTWGGTVSAQIVAGCGKYFITHPNGVNVALRDANGAVLPTLFKNAVFELKADGLIVAELVTNPGFPVDVTVTRWF